MDTRVGMPWGLTLTCCPKRPTGRDPTSAFFLKAYMHGTPVSHHRGHRCPITLCVRRPCDSSPPMPRTVNRHAVIRRALGRTDLLPSDKLVLVALVQRIKVDGRSAGLTWPKVELLSQDVGLDRRTVRRALDHLDAAGAIQRWRQPRGYLYRVPPTWDEVDERGVSAGLVSIHHQHDHQGASA